MHTLSIASALHIFLLAEPGKPDTILALPTSVTTEALLKKLRMQTRRSSHGFRLSCLDVGDFELGTERPRPASPLPLSDNAIHKDAAYAIEPEARALWRVTEPGKSDRLMITGCNLNAQEALDIARLDSSLAEIHAAGAGLYPVQKTIFSYRRDGRWLDEKGYIQLNVPTLN